MKNRFLEKCAASLFAGVEQKQSFLKSFENPNHFDSCLVWLHNKIEDTAENLQLKPVEWIKAFAVDRVLQGEPGKSAMHEAGACYVMDYSSVVAASVLSAVEIPSPQVLDMCAAPGGKSILAYKWLNPQLLVCNETINSRIRMLISNLKRCDLKPCGVWSRDPAYLSQKFPHSFDVVLVDAPCSGQSLLTRGEKNPGAFHPQTIALNEKRQKRILMESAKLVRGGGYLAYMTCTYSREENEKNVIWFLKKNSHYEVVKVPLLNKYQSHLVDFPAYRIWPQKGEGSGSFAVLLRNTKETRENELEESEFKYIWKNGM